MTSLLLTLLLLVVLYTPAAYALVRVLRATAWGTVQMRQQRKPLACVACSSTWAALLIAAGALGINRAVAGPVSWGEAAVFLLPAGPSAGLTMLLFDWTATWMPANAPTLPE